MTSTRPVPYLSAKAPKKGWLTPQNRFWKAIARPKVERSQPRSASIGNWKKPMADRGPKVMTAISDPGEAAPTIGAPPTVQHRCPELLPRIEQDRLSGQIALDMDEVLFDVADDVPGILRLNTRPRSPAVCRSR